VTVMVATKNPPAKQKQNLTNRPRVRKRKATPAPVASKL